MKRMIISVFLFLGLTSPGAFAQSINYVCNPKSRPEVCQDIKKYKAPVPGFIRYNKIKDKKILINIIPKEKTNPYATEFAWEMEKVFKSRGSDYVPWDKKAPSENVNVRVEIDVKMEMTDNKDYWRAVVYLRYLFSPSDEQLFAGYISTSYQEGYEVSNEELDNIFMWRDSLGESVSKTITNFENSGLFKLMKKATEK